MQDLLPCPFCGNLKVEIKEPTFRKFYFRCNGCGLSKYARGGSYYKSTRTAIKSWNIRAEWEV